MPQICLSGTDARPELMSDVDSALFYQMENRLLHVKR